MKRYKALFLDWDDTIGDFRTAEHHTLQELFATFSLSRFYPSYDDYFAVYHARNVLLWERYGRGEITKDFLQRDRFLYPLLYASEVRSLPVEGLETLADTIGQSFLRLTTTYASLLPGAFQAVRLLAARYPLIVVSNGFVEVQYTKIRRSGLFPCFRHIVLSEEVGVQKPDPLIFEKALALDSLSPDEVLMIGDSWTSDVLGARRAGIDQLWIRPADAPCPDPSAPPSLAAASLLEAATLL